MQMYDLWGGSIFAIVHIVLQCMGFGMGALVGGGSLTN
jgi:hypothetical protein